MGERQLGLARHQTDVALHGEREADADGVAVHRRDDGLPDLPGRKRDRIGAELGFLAPRERLGACRHVGADAERRAGAGQDHRPHVVAAVALAVGLGERARHGSRERVPVRRAVERHDGDAVGYREP